MEAQTKARNPLRPSVGNRPAAPLRFIWFAAVQRPVDLAGRQLSTDPQVRAD
jgi:hypothetical protein